MILLTRYVMFVKMRQNLQEQVRWWKTVDTNQIRPRSYNPIPYPGLYWTTSGCLHATIHTPFSAFIYWVKVLLSGYPLGAFFVEWKRIASLNFSSDKFCTSWNLLTFSYTWRNFPWIPIIQLTTTFLSTLFWPNLKYFRPLKFWNFSEPLKFRF